MGSSAASRGTTSRGVDQTIVPRPAHLKHGAAVVPNWDSGKMERYVIRSRPEAPWGLLVDRASRSRFSDKPGASIHKRVPIVGRCCRPFPFQKLRPPFDRL